MAENVCLVSVEFFPPVLSERFCNLLTFDLLRFQGYLCYIL